VVEYGKGSAPSYTTAYTYNALNSLTCVNQSGQYRVFGYDSMNRLILADNPETRVQAISSCTAGSPTNTYTYDNANNLISKTDTGGFTITYQPDLLNRVSQKTTSDGTTTQYTFDQNLAIPNQTDPNYPVGRLSSVSFGTVTQTYRYDALGRYQSSEQTVAGQANSPFVFHYNHVPAGLATEKYPSQRTIATTYDAAGRPNGVTGYASGITYAPHGAVSGMTLGSGVQESWSFNSRLQPTCLTAGVPQAAPLLQLTNAYTTATPGTGGACALSGTDNNGNVVSQTTTAGSANFNLSYSYADGLNRITSATETNQETIQNQASPGLGWAQQFSYNDAWGNRTLGSTSISSGWSYPPAFDAGNHVTGTGWSYSTDHRGNLASTPEMASMTYDSESRLQTAVGPYGTSQYIYDGNGRRVMATQGGTQTVYVYDAMGQLAGEYGGTATGSGREYLTADHLGSTRLVTGTGGTVVERHDYAPFGEEIAAQGCGQPAGSAGRSPRCDIAGYGAASEVPLLFTGKERDGNTGLDYFGARYFSGAQGRFTSPDPMVHPRESQFGEEGFLADPQRWNKYAYALNNPLRYIDPDGRETQTYLGAPGYEAQLRNDKRMSATEKKVWATLAAGAAGFFAPEIVGAGVAISRWLPGLAPAMMQFLQDESGGVPGVSSRLTSALNSTDPAIQAEGQVGSFLSRNGLLQDFNTTVKDAATGLPRQIDIVAGQAGQYVVEVTTGTGKGKLGQAAAQAAASGKEVIVYGTNLTKGFLQEAQRQGLKVAQSLDELKRMVGGGSQ
jgi:RHS repeat-associated protein